MRFLFVLLLTLLIQPAFADKFDKYLEPTSAMMTDYVFDAGLVKIEKDEQVVEYAALKDCAVYETVRQDMFRQQQMAAQVAAGQADRMKAFNKRMYLRIPGRLSITRYNFNTQAFDLDDLSKMSNVNVVSIFNLNRGPCNDAAIRLFPTSFAAKLSYPISLRRVPLQADTAQALYDKLPPNPENRRLKALYTDLYITIDGIMPNMEVSKDGKRVMLMGQIDAIDIFTDEYRTKRLKRLDYSATY